MTPQQIEAMKLALEALKNNKLTHLYCEDTWYSCPKHEDGCANEAEGDECNCGADDVNAQFDQAITALEEALAQPEQEPVAKNEEGRITWLVDDWPQNCFLYAEPPKWTPVEIGVDVTNEGAHVVGMYVLPDAVRYVFYSEFHYAPQRTWVWLTKVERIELLESTHPNNRWSLLALCEALLKEKNT